jgi:hypothetical protein
MCYLVTIGTREDRPHVGALLGADFPLTLRPSKNPSLRAAFPPEDKLYEVTFGLCSCDLITQHKTRSAEDRRAKLRAQYDRKGWSKGKIARALADWETGHGRELEKRTEPARDLIKLLKTLALRPGGVRVVVHFYSGPFDSEEIALVGASSVPVERFEVGALPEDTLTDVVRDAISR